MLKETLPHHTIAPNPPNSTEAQQWSGDRPMARGTKAVAKGLLSAGFGLRGRPVLYIQAAPFMLIAFCGPHLARDVT